MVSPSRSATSGIITPGKVLRNTETIQTAMVRRRASSLGSKGASAQIKRGTSAGLLQGGEVEALHPVRREEAADELRHGLRVGEEELVAMIVSGMGGPGAFSGSHTP
jgi:hypothetical protein